MRRELFDYVEQIRNADKYFDVSILEIRRALRVKGKVDLFTELDFEDERGLPVTAALRLNIAGGIDRPITSYTLALKLHNERIDGIDYETRFDMADGSQGRGWHRHNWDATETSARYQKVPVRDLESIASDEQFLIRGLSILRIRTNTVDHGQLLSA